MANPYSALPERNFWRSAIGSRNFLEIDQLWRPKFNISTADLTATSGSCFAQHLSRAMIASGFDWVDSEPAPKWLTPDQARAQNYGIFSFRTGNIYTTALLRQWLEMATGRKPDSKEVWKGPGNRFYDPLRPAIAPNGFVSEQEVRVCREQTLRSIQESLSSIDLFVFTLGLTEGWRNRSTGLVYPMCPGTVAGEFDPKQHEFHNYRYDEILEDMLAVMDLLREIKPGIKFLFTVSPVPLTATASDSHVLPATIYSKSVLRAVAGYLGMSQDDADYFPSFEIISSFPFKGAFFESNMREVAKAGVAHVMKQFFGGLSEAGMHTAETPQRAPRAARGDELQGVPEPEEDREGDVKCEDELLEAFAGED